jgi:phosphate transport system permease protein
MSEQPDKANPHSLTRPPTGNEIRFDRGFQLGTRFFALAGLGLLVAILLVIGYDASPAVAEHGAGFLVDTTWDPNEDEFGILPQILGTLYSSVIALILGGGLGIFAAIYLSQGFLPPAIEKVMKNIIELLAAIPSVVYGLWGIFVVIPALRGPCEWLHENLSFIPFFSTKLSGPGVLPASLVLSIMILPTVAAVAREAIAAVPNRLSHAALGLGATRWEAILAVVLPTASTGIFGALVLGFGRALGETMALAMLMGNTNVLRPGRSSRPANTLASLLANPVPRSRQGRGRRADVRRDRAAPGHHPGSSTSSARWSCSSASKRPAGAATDAGSRVKATTPTDPDAGRASLRGDPPREVAEAPADLRQHDPSRDSPSALTLLRSVPAVMGGGIGNAIVGTLVMVGIAALISVPSASWRRSSSPSSGLTASWPPRRASWPRC